MGRPVEPRAAAADTLPVLIREDVATRVPPERAWEMLSDPSLHAQWNPRIVSTKIVSPGPPAQGFRYRVTYELSGRRNEMEAQIIEFSPPLRFVARLEERVKGDGRNWQRFVVETYLLTRSGDRTLIRHEIRVHHAGLNPFLRLLIWFISRTGRPTGQPFMERFRELVESQAR